MKKVLIICDLFPPAFGPRMGYLCKYLRIQGWEPIVLTEAVNENTFTFLTKGSQTTYVQFYTASNFFFKKFSGSILFYSIFVSTIRISECTMQQKN